MLDEARRAGIRRVLADRLTLDSVKVDGFSVLEVSEEPGKGRVSWVRIASAEDMNDAIQAGDRNQEFVVVECSDWRVIPLENLIAEFRRRGRRIYAYASSGDDIKTALTILEKGVDGVVIPPSSIGSAGKLTERADRKVAVVAARVSRVVDAGLGERACIDTTAQLAPGEGMLIGSKASFFFLVHGETIPSAYIPARPFRVNAGAIHSYLLSSEGKTRYLSELEPPDPVTVVDREGSLRTATVGRVKIEKRPLVLVEAKAGDSTGSVILQKAETIRLIRSDGSPVSVTELKPGDEVLVHTEDAKGRHFGGEVDEYIIEK